MSHNPCIQVNMESLQKLITSFGPEISVCIRGRHAVGKSEGTYQAAAKLRHDFWKDPKNCEKYGWSYEQGLPVIERRLSQLTEGDLTGMPSLDADRKSTSFKPCDWFIDACERPVVLFLDERNRALEGVKQAVFQIMDSRAFYGHKLHPGTRVIVAENVGDSYTVNQCDPAEVSRAATVELCPTVQEWVEYAQRAGCDELITSFISKNPEFLENNGVTDGTKVVMEANKKGPDRRSWFKLHGQLERAGLYKDLDSTLFYQMVASMVGIEPALALDGYKGKFQRTITPKEVYDNWPEAKKKLGKDIPNARYVEISKKMEIEADSTKDPTTGENIFMLTDEQIQNLYLFMKDAPPEVAMKCWAIANSNETVLRKIHPVVTPLILQIAELPQFSGESTEESSETKSE